MKGAIVTADAMSCQKAIAEKITDKKADYALSVKENQRALHEDIKDWFEAFENKLSKSAVHETFDKDHGRLERRKYALLTDIKWLEQRNEWKGLKAVGMVRATVEEKGSKT